MPSARRLLAVVLAAIILVPWPDCGLQLSPVRHSLGACGVTGRRPATSADRMQQQQLGLNFPPAPAAGAPAAGIDTTGDSAGEEDFSISFKPAAATISPSSSSSGEVSTASLVAVAARPVRHSRRSRFHHGDPSAEPIDLQIETPADFTVTQPQTTPPTAVTLNPPPATPKTTAKFAPTKPQATKPQPAARKSPAKPAPAKPQARKPQPAAHKPPAEPVAKKPAAVKPPAAKPQAPMPIATKTPDISTDPQTAQYNAIKEILPKLFSINGRSWQLVDGFFKESPTKLADWIPAGIPSATQDYSEFVPTRGQGYISLTAARINDVVYITEVYAYDAGLDLQQLPKLVQALPQITSFTCSNCLRNSKDITGSTLPQDLPFLAPPTFKMLSLGGCKLTGSLPDSWRSWNTIEQIWVWDNEITGSMPESWSNMPNLRVLYAEENQLTGSLPESWGKGSIPDHLAVYLHKNNKISGSIPLSWGRFTGVLDVTGTNITGCVPDGLISTIIMDSSPDSCSVNDPNRELTALKNIRRILTSISTTDMLATWSDPISSPAELIKGSSPPHYCTSWTGVKCDNNNKITVLDLSIVTPDKAEVTIPLPTMMQQIKRFNNLRALNLSNLALTGLLADDRPLLDDMSNLPSDLPSLQILDLSNNPGLSGQLPKMWAGLTTLQVLDLSGTNVTAHLPDSWASLQSLRAFKASNTQIYGTLPDSWGMLKQLTVLELSNTNITGRIPAAWADPLAMRMVAVAALQSAKQDAAVAAATAEGFKGSLSSFRAAATPGQTVIPIGVTQAALSSPPRNRGSARTTVATAALAPASSDQITQPSSYQSNSEAVTNGSLTAAVKIYNSAQQSVATASTIVAQLQQTLDSISAGSSASMSSFGLGMTSLQVLNLANNTLTGTLPAGFSSFSYMKVLDLSNNGMSGSLPMEWATMDYLEELLLNNNKLSGFLPDYWARLTNLRTLDLSNNTLSGEIPITWISMQNVATIDLSNNRFSGRVPEEWEFMSGPNYKLRCLSVYGNNYLENLSQTEKKFKDAGGRVRLATKPEDTVFCDAQGSPAVTPTGQR